MSSCIKNNCAQAASLDNVFNSLSNVFAKRFLFNHQIICAKTNIKNLVTNVLRAFTSQQLYISVSSGGGVLVHPPRETNTLEIPPRKGKGSDEEVV